MSIGMSAGTTVRQAGAGDATTMAELAARSDTAAHWKIEDYEKVFVAGAPARRALVVEERGAVVGFIVGACVGSEWEIENVVVAPERLRRGLGDALMQAFIRLAGDAGAESVFLEVRESNGAARGLYEKWGFVELGTRKGYYSGPVEDAVVYRKTGLRARSGQVK